MHYLNALLILAISSSSIYGQESLNEHVIDFESKCLKEIDPSDTTSSDFQLKEYRTAANSTFLSFEIKANCGQINKGTLSIHGDTLKLMNTDYALKESSTTKKSDSLGIELEVISETYSSQIAFCDCLISFKYEVSLRMEELKFLVFHNRTFKLAFTDN